MMPLRLCQITETAAFAATRSQLIVESRTPIPERSLRKYWQHSRARHHCWIRELDSLNSQFGSLPRHEHADLWPQAELLLTEVFVAEVLTRVWTAILTAHDHRRYRQIAEPIARHSLSSHIEARNHAMILMVGEPEVTLSDIARVDRVRRKAERWSDLLIGPLVVEYGLHELAFDVSRAVEFAETRSSELVQAADAPVGEFIRTGLHLAFRDYVDPYPATEAANQGILQAVIGSFPPDTFDEFGLSKSVSRVRCERSGQLDDAVHSRGGTSSRRADGSHQRLSFKELRQRSIEE